MASHSEKAHRTVSVAREDDPVLSKVDIPHSFERPDQKVRLIPAMRWPSTLDASQEFLEWLHVFPRFPRFSNVPEELL